MTFHRNLARLIIRGRYILPVVLLICTILAGTAISRTVINYDLTSYLAKDTMTIRGARVVQEEFKAANATRESNSTTQGDLRGLQMKIGQEIPVALAISVAVVLVMLTVTSHAWLEPLLILFVLAVSIVLNMGTNFVFSSVSFITFAVCAILQLALSIDYAIMLLHAWNAHLDSGMDAKEAMAEALSECFMRIASSAMTTVAGLLSLLFMSFTIGFDIGMVLSKGIIISMLCVFLLMPSVTLLCGKALRRTKHKALPIGGDRLAGLVFRIRKPLAAGMVLLVLAGLYLNFRVEYTFTGKPGEAATPGPLALIVPGGDTDADYDRQRDLVSRLQAVTKEDGTPAIGKIQAMVTDGADALRYYSADELAEMTGISPAVIRGYLTLSGLDEPVRGDRLLDAAVLPAQFVPALAEKREQLAYGRAMLNSDAHTMIVLHQEFTASSPDFIPVMTRILDSARAVYPEQEIYATGVLMSTYDISNAFRDDLLKVNLITFAAIFLIVAISFRSLRMPLVLVLVIEGAIWITIGFSALINEPVFFISYLICVSIQMGATIDYGILLSDQYRSRRAEGLAPRAALTAALKKALPTILTPGIILIVAGFAVGKVCTIYYISSIGLLVSRGALVSTLLMLTFLPSLLLLCDRFIIRPRRPSAPS